MTVAKRGSTGLYRDILTFGLSAIYASSARGITGCVPPPISISTGHWRGHFSFPPVQVSPNSHRIPHGYRSYRYDHNRGTLYDYGHAGLMWGNGPWRMELDRIMADPGTQRQWGR